LETIFFHFLWFTHCKIFFFVLEVFIFLFPTYHQTLAYKLS
jgi:hypothetical protein